MDNYKDDDIIRVMGREMTFKEYKGYMTSLSVSGGAPTSLSRASGGGYSANIGGCQPMPQEYYKIELIKKAEPILGEHTNETEDTCRDSSPFRIKKIKE